MKLAWVCAALALVLLATACGGGSGEVDLARLPSPRVEGLEPRVVEAIRAAEARVRREPDSAEAWRRLGAVYDAHRLAAAAEAAYSVSNELDPEDFWTAYQLAVMHEMLGSDLRETLRRFQAFGAEGEALPQVHLRMGGLHEKLGELEAALDRYALAVELDPSFAMAHRVYGQALLVAGRPQDAARELEEARRLGGAQDGPTLASLAQAYGQLGQEDRAREVAALSAGKGGTLLLTDALRSEITYLGVDSRTCFDRAQFRMSARDYSGALEDLLIAEEHMPDQPYLQLRLASCYAELRQDAEAQSRLQRTLELRAQEAEGVDESSPPDDLVALDATLSRYRMKYEQPSAALRPFVERASRLASAGDLEGTLEEFARAEAVAPLTPRVRLAWARVAREHGDAHLALAQLDELLSMDPGNLDGYLLRGELLEELGNRAGALASYRRALRIAPRHPVAARVAALGG